MPTRKRKRRNGPYTEGYRLKALKHYVTVNSNVKQACRDLMVPRTTLYFWIHHFPEFIEREKERQHIPDGSILELQQALLSLPPSEGKILAMLQIIKSILERIQKLIPIEPDMNKLTNALTAITNAFITENQQSKSYSNSTKRHIHRKTNNTYSSQIY